MAPSPPIKWSQVRVWLLLFLVFMAATYVFGRPGDAEAGLIGAGIFGVIGAGICAVELIGRRLTRKHPIPTGEQSPRQPPPSERDGQEG